MKKHILKIRKLYATVKDTRADEPKKYDDTWFAWAKIKKNLEKSAEDIFRELIKEFLDKHDVVANVRIQGFEFYFINPAYDWTKNEIRLGVTSIFNAVGSLDKKARWINKITISQGASKEFAITTHKARTDPKFLSPLDIEFRDFLKKVYTELNKDL